MSSSEASSKKEFLDTLAFLLRRSDVVRIPDRCPTNQLLDLSTNLGTHLDLRSSLPVSASRHLL